MMQIDRDKENTGSRRGEKSPKRSTREAKKKKKKEKKVVDGRIKWSKRILKG